MKDSVPINVLDALSKLTIVSNSTLPQFYITFNRWCHSASNNDHICVFFAKPSGIIGHMHKGNLWTPLVIKGKWLKGLVCNRLILRMLFHTVQLMISFLFQYNTPKLSLKNFVMTFGIVTGQECLPS